MIRLGICAALVLIVDAASAQRAETTAASEADDAFGFTIAGETIGLYSDKYVRGFSPVNAGNLRLDGLYFDRQGEFNERLFADVAIRVGLTALETPLPAPSGIADYSLRRPGDENLLSLAGGVLSFGTSFMDIDWTAGGDEGWAIAAGASVYPDEHEKDGTDGRYYAWFASPTWTAESGLRVTAFASEDRYEDYESEITYYTAGPYRPPRIPRGPYLGQPWAGDTGTDANYGLIVDRAQLAGWAIKAGVFRSEWDGDREIFQYVDAVTADGEGRFGTITYPKRTYASWSGELQLSRPFYLATDWRAEVLVSVRGRDTSIRASRESEPVEAPAHVGEPPPILEPPPLVEGPHDHESVRQLVPGVALQLGWQQRLRLQLGVQRADYRREIRVGATGETTSTDERPWLGSASASWAMGHGRLAYVAYARGFEDSGTAPSFADNAGEVLPASHTEQWDAGLRWRLRGDTDLVAAVFRLERPGRALDATGRFGLRGLVRNEGIELSIVSRPFKGFSVVTGLLAQRPRMLDAPDDVGDLAVGISDYSGILELDYEPDHWRGFGASLSLLATGPAEAKADNSVEVQEYVLLDAGLRYNFTIRGAPASLRASVTNLTDEYAWEAHDDEGFRWIAQRAYQLVLAADFP